ncbi:MAG: IclR family transcriptional regulator C-terminal domain-containing protein [Syntrophobacteraceae bacterium]
MLAKRLAFTGSLCEHIAMPKSSDQFVQSFARGLSVIRCFGPNAREMTITKIAELTNLSRAGARRILCTLHNLGYVRADGRRFSLTPRILHLGYSYLSSLPFWDFAQPIMENMVARVHETSSIALLEGTDIVYVMRVPTRRILTVNISIGTSLPAYAQSMGRVLLGGLTAEELDCYFATVELKPFTKKTIVDPVRLRKIIAEDRRKGWSWVNGELEEGICGIAVPLIDSNGKIIAAMNIVTNTGRSSKSRAIKTFLPELTRAVEQINAGLKVRRT